MSTFTHEGTVSLESVGGFGTEGIDARDIDYRAILPAFMRIYMFPGRAERLTPEALRTVRSGEIPPRVALVISTSGSEGEPRGVLLSNANLDAAAAASNQLLPLGAADAEAEVVGTD